YRLYNIILTSFIFGNVLFFRTSDLYIYTLSLHDALPIFDFQEGLRQQLLQAGVFGLERFQSLRVRHAQPAELAPPEVIARFREAMPPAQILHRQPRISLAQEADDLLFREPLLHRPIPFR